MSRGSRWYTFSRTVAEAGAEVQAIKPGTVYEVYGWSRTKEAAIAKRDKLDRAGRAAINVFSPSLQQAMADVMEVYPGVVVAGYISPENKRAGRAVVKAAVVRAIFCPYTDVILDMRRAVVVSSERQQFVMAASHWDSLGELRQKSILARAKVYDGRELFKC